MASHSGLGAVLRPAQFPFTAVVGMDDLRLALVLNAVSPAIGGVLVRGEKGTAKSTAVRALAAVLPEVDVVAGCRFSCDPAQPDPFCPDGPHDADAGSLRRPAVLQELPVGASEDRLTGSLDLEKALTEGVSSYEPGLLAGAHRGVLYVDEVNLLHDHLVDLLLDAAALGTSYVEREGVSVRHAARFLLVGTMNPEEGELRPQLLDRFGLTVEVAAPRAPAARAEVVRRRLGFDADPAGFSKRFAAEESELADRIAAARAGLPLVDLPDRMLAKIASVCAAFEVDGLRADIVTARAAVAHAAWDGRDEVTLDDIRVAARLSLPHRRRRNPFDAPGLDEQQLEDALNAPDPDEPTPDPGAEASDAGTEEGSAAESPSEPEPSEPGPNSSDSGPAPESGPATAPAPAAETTSSDRPGTDHAEASETSDGADGPDSIPADQHPDRVEIVAAGEPFRARTLTVPGIGAGAPGRRSAAITDHGRTVRAVVPQGRVHQLHLRATVAAAAPFQRARGRTSGGLVVHRSDLRAPEREGREGNLVLFAVDASGSMAARSRMSVVKSAVLSLLLDAYQRRDKVGLISFRGHGAELLLPPTSSVDTAAARLKVLPTGGRTPLSDGLVLAQRTLVRERLRDPSRRALLVVMTDGRHTSGPAPQAAAGLVAATGVHTVVVDCESGRVLLGLAGQLAGQLGAVCLSLADLAVGDALADSVRALRAAA